MVVEEMQDQDGPAARAAGLATFGWEKRTRRLVDQYTFIEYHQIDNVPRIEDHIHENLEMVVATEDVTPYVPPSTSSVSSSRLEINGHTGKTSTKSSTITSKTGRHKSARSPRTTTDKGSNNKLSSPRKREKQKNLESPRRCKHRDDKVKVKKSVAKVSDDNEDKVIQSPTIKVPLDKKPVPSDGANVSSLLTSPCSNKVGDKKQRSVNTFSSPSSRKGTLQPTSLESVTSDSLEVPSLFVSPTKKKTSEKKERSGNIHNSPLSKKVLSPAPDAGIPSLFTSGFPSTPTTTTTTEASTPRVTNSKSISRKTTGTTPKGNLSRLPKTPTSVPTKKSSSLDLSPTNKPPLRLPKTPASEQKKKSNSLGAFLHKNAVEQFAEKIIHAAVASNDDAKSVGSRSISSRSVSELSHAERSKAEESVHKRPKRKGRRPGYNPTNSPIRNQMFGIRVDQGNNSSNSIGTEMNDNSLSTRSLSRSRNSGRFTEEGMQSIDEMSITDFSITDTALSPTRSPTKKSPIGRGGTGGGGVLGSFLQQKAISEGDDGNDGADDMRSVASASTFGNRSISDLSKAEQSGLEKRLRDRSKNGGRESDENKSTTSNDLGTADSSGSNLGTVTQTLKPPSYSPIRDVIAPPPPPPPVPRMDSEKNGMGIDDSDNDSIHLEDVVFPIGKKQLRFKDGHSEREIPELTDSLYDDLFYTSEELADFRYEAFLEECGLDVDEFK